jgi:hypothetical protein
MAVVFHPTNHSGETVEERANQKLHFLHQAALALLLLNAAVPLYAGLQAGIAAEALKAAETWLLSDCGVGEQDNLTPILQRYKDQLEPLFLNAMTNGPDSPLLVRFEKSASARFDLRQNVLKSGQGLGVSADAIAAARKMTRQEYIDGEKRSYVLGYESRAASALAIVGGARARAALSALAAKSDSPLQHSAEQALLALQAVQK